MNTIEKIKNLKTELKFSVEEFTGLLGKKERGILSEEVYRQEILKSKKIIKNKFTELELEAKNIEIGQEIQFDPLKEITEDIFNWISDLNIVTNILRLYGRLIYLSEGESIFISDMKDKSGTFFTYKSDVGRVFRVPIYFSGNNESEKNQVKNAFKEKYVFDYQVRVLGKLVDIILNSLQYDTDMSVYENEFFGKIVEDKVEMKTLFSTPQKEDYLHKEQKDFLQINTDRRHMKKIELYAPLDYMNELQDKIKIDWN